MPPFNEALRATFNTSGWEPVVRRSPTDEALHNALSAITTRVVRTTFSEETILKEIKAMEAKYAEMHSTEYKDRRKILSWLGSPAPSKKRQRRPDVAAMISEYREKHKKTNVLTNRGTALINSGQYVEECLLSDGEPPSPEESPLSRRLTITREEIDRKSVV